MLQILYLVHDLNDSAVHRRCEMLRAGGAKVAVAGFVRGQVAPSTEFTNEAITLGTTRDAAFGQRIAAVLKAGASLGGKLRGLARPDVIVARNLEMLALANRARHQFGGDIPIVYECLDLHRLVLRPGPVGAAMRMLERSLAANASLLVTSSPAFIREYFTGRKQIAAPIELIENKVLELAEAFDTPSVARPADGDPWRIGWFGMLRCRRSFALLSEFTRRMDGKFVVHLHGRPARSELGDFESAVAAEPYMHFGGPYRGAAELGALYGKVHFAWTIDFFEEGLNSEWLLPNRLYEGCRFGAVPIALARTETGRFLAARKLGILVDRADAAGIADALTKLDHTSFLAARDAVGKADRRNWVADRADCIALVGRLKNLGENAGRQVLSEAIA